MKHALPRSIGVVSLTLIGAFAASALTLYALDKFGRGGLLARLRSLMSRPRPAAPLASPEEAPPPSQLEDEASWESFPASDPPAY